MRKIADLEGNSKKGKIFYIMVGFLNQNKNLAWKFL
jgi:hypothetical protein